MNSMLFFLGGLAWKSSGLLLFGFAIARAVRDASASLRSFVWFCTLLALSILPAFHFVGPRLELPWLSAVRVVRVSAVRVEKSNVPSEMAPPAPSFAGVTPQDGIPCCWGLGLAAVALYFGAGYIGVRGWKGLMRPVTWSTDDLMSTGVIGRSTIFESPDCKIPMTWGWRKPVILFPAAAGEWPSSRRRHALLHELAHVRRGDWLAQIFVQAVCAVYWWNPLVWLASRRWRLTAEEACDDVALAEGAQPSGYATDLLAIAKGCAGINRRMGFACAMAQRPPLDRRLRRILDPATRRNRISRTSKTALLLTAVTSALVIARLAITHARAEETPDPAAKPAQKAPAGGRVFADGNQAFLVAYDDFDKAEKLEKGGKLDDALSLYQECRRITEMIGTRWPNWNPSVIRFRQKKAEEAIERIRAREKQILRT